MPRRPREWIDGGIYHVFSRGSNRQAIFLNDGDYLEFEMLLGDTIQAPRARLLRLVPDAESLARRLPQPAEGLSRFMKNVNHRYALRFDRRWGRTAHVFQNRFGAVLPEDRGAVPLDSALCRAQPGRGRALCLSVRLALDELRCHRRARARARHTCEWPRSSLTSDTSRTRRGSGTSTSSSADHPQGESTWSDTATEVGDARGDRRLTSLAQQARGADRHRPGTICA